NPPWCRGARPRGRGRDGAGEDDEGGGAGRRVAGDGQAVEALAAGGAAGGHLLRGDALTQRRAFQGGPAPAPSGAPPAPAVVGPGGSGLLTKREHGDCRKGRPRRGRGRVGGGGVGGWWGGGSSAGTSRGRTGSSPAGANCPRRRR